jgi:hypothetical protein
MRRMAENEEVSKKKRVVVTGAGSGPTYYANHINVGVSPFDMRIRFYQIEDADEETLNLREAVTIYLSPGQARALRRLLINKAAEHDAAWTTEILAPGTAMKTDKDDSDGEA